MDAPVQFYFLRMAWMPLHYQAMFPTITSTTLLYSPTFLEQMQTRHFADQFHVILMESSNKLQMVEILRMQWQVILDSLLI